jgi:LytS/YehU family sensor histidine kinase
MVFIPFIENAFKHTTNKKLENAITIQIVEKDDTVQLRCENKFDPKSVKQPIGGLGNGLVVKRLDLIYAGKHTLEVNRNDELYTVNLTIPND